MNDLVLPPPYRAERFDPDISALAAGRAAAAAGREEGALFWGERAGRLQCAVVLRPDRPRRETLPAVYMAALALADALAAFAAPPAPIGFRWPDGILVDGGLAGRVRLACADCGAEAVPAWAVLGFELALSRPGGEPGLAPDLTSIAEEGFDGFSAIGLIEGFARQLLRWAGRFEAEGSAAIAAEWWRRAGFAEGAAIGIDADGNLRLRREGRVEVQPLEAVLCDEAADG